MKKEALQIGTPVWTVRATNCQFPRDVYILSGNVAYLDEFQVWIHVAGRRDISAQPGELFATEDEARDYLIAWLEASLKVQRKAKKKQGEAKG